MLVAGGTPVVFSYLFAHAPSEDLGLPGEASGVFVPHASEIAFVYGSRVPSVTAEEAALAKQMCSYWIAFAKSANPNHGTAPNWPPWTTATPDNGGDTVLRLDVASAGGVRSQQGLRKQACDLMDRLAQRSVPEGSV